MKKIFALLTVLIGILILAACSNDSAEQYDDSTADFGVETESSMNQDVATDQAEEQGVEEQDDAENSDVPEANRKIIYTANLQLEVKELDQAVEDIGQEVSNKGGYIVETSIYGNGDEQSRTGFITARIPNEHFQSFLEFVDTGSFRVVEKSTSGQDVTEEYVDLESRLKSKRVVEERLITFLEQAEKTEDLLKISNDLAKVQEEIERIVGRMAYLDNQVDLATVSIHLKEKNITLSGISDDEINTWDRTVEQFMKSINFLINVFSGLIVFLVGGLPILLPLVIIVLIVYFRWRKKRR